MNVLDRLRAICLGFPGAYERVAKDAANAKSGARPARARPRKTRRPRGRA